MHVDLAGDCDKALRAVKSNLRQETVEIVESLIAAGEYGVAIEWLGDALLDDRVSMTGAAFHSVEEVAVKMGLDARYVEQLRVLVAPPPIR